MARMLINNVYLNAEKAGKGPPVVALHGFTGSIATWKPFVRAIQDEYTIITADVLGHGASDAPDDRSLYSMEKMVQSLEKVLDRLCIERVHWLGYSLGARIALSAAIALPHRTSSLILESGSPGLRTQEERDARVHDDEALADWLEEAGIEQFVDYWQSIPLWASQARLSDAAREMLRAQRLNNNPMGLANSLRGVGTGAQPALHHRLVELQAPALFMAGEDDAKYVDVAHEMHQAVTHSRMEIVREAGHAVHLEQPDRFNQAVLGFLKADELFANTVTETRAKSLPNH